MPAVYGRTPLRAEARHGVALEREQREGTSNGGARAARGHEHCATECRAEAVNVGVVVGGEVRAVADCFYFTQIRKSVSVLPHRHFRTVSHIPVYIHQLHGNIVGKMQRLFVPKDTVLRVSLFRIYS